MRQGSSKFQQTSVFSAGLFVFSYIEESTWSSTLCDPTSISNSLSDRRGANVVSLVAIKTNCTNSYLGVKGLEMETGWGEREQVGRILLIVFNF